MIKPTLRTKKRYVGFKIHTEERGISAKEIDRTFFEMIKELYGEVGAAAIGYKFIEYDETSGKGIVRFDRSFIMEGIAVFPFIKHLKTKEGKKIPVKTVPVSTSGSLKKLRKRLYGPVV